MLDHVGINVRDYERSRDFYTEALRPLGLTAQMDFPEFKATGFGRDGKPLFWIAKREPLGAGTHVAFSSGDRETVDAFHAAALAAGGVDNGPPGLRPHYHAHYYGAFVLDPDGNNAEAVCHTG